MLVALLGDLSVFIYNNWMILIWFQMDIFSWRFVLKILFDSVGCDDVNLVTFTCDFLNGDSFHDVLHCCFLFFTHGKNPNIGSLSSCLAENIIFMDYSNLIGRYRSCYNDHNSNQWWWFECPLVEKLLLLQKCHI